MSDGIKAMYEDMEEQAYTKDINRIKQMKPEEIKQAVDKIYDDLKWLLNQDLRLTQSEWATLKDMNKHVKTLKGFS